MCVKALEKRSDSLLIYATLAVEMVYRTEQALSRARDACLRGPHSVLSTHLRYAFAVSD